MNEKSNEELMIYETPSVNLMEVRVESVLAVSVVEDGRHDGGNLDDGNGDTTFPWEQQ
jgi:hypothetical protein